jgi:hypothetical protein
MQPVPLPFTGLMMTVLKTTLFWVAIGLSLAWVFFIGAITLGFTMISKRAGEREREHDLDEEMGEE